MRLNWFKDYVKILETKKFKINYKFEKYSHQNVIKKVSLSINGIKYEFNKLDEVYHFLKGVEEGVEKFSERI